MHFYLTYQQRISVQKLQYHYWKRTEGGSMPKKPVHVTPREDGWAVIREGNERATSVHRTQKEAEQKGRQTARNDKTEFFLHNKQGQIRERDSYGNDPYPPKG
jgi:hypothetical protein